MSATAVPFPVSRMTAGIKEIIVSGPIAAGPTTAVVTYFVVDKARNAIVGNINLPNASAQSRAFKMTVKVPSFVENIDVGTFDGAGRFVSAGFTVEAGTTPGGAVGPR